jgi:ABC-2 type transport system ATP-binding protein
MLLYNYSTFSVMRQSVPEQPIIATSHVNLRFAEDVGIHDLSFYVQPGTIFGLIGPSGSGKTTTVRLLTGRYRPDNGQIKVLGQNPAHFRPSTREQIGYMPQQFLLYPNLTVWENLSFVASMYGMSFGKRRRRMEEVLSFVELDDAASRLGNQLSGGMQRRLLLASALVHNPSLLFADEPTAGIDPVLRQKFWDFFRSVREERRTLVVTTQYIGEAAYCDIVGVMREGRLVHVDTPENLRRKALGGELVRLVVDTQQAFPAARRLQNLRLVSAVRYDQEQQGVLYLTVERAAEALPTIMQHLSDEPAVPIQSIEPYQPPFDEVFVRLLEETDHRHA